MQLEDGCIYINSPLTLLALSDYLNIDLDILKTLNNLGKLKEYWVNSLEESWE
jgi:hypothetical protein